MNGFEVNEAASSVVVVGVAFDSTSRKSATLAVTLLAKKRPTEKIDFVAALLLHLLNHYAIVPNIQFYG